MDLLPKTHRDFGSDVFWEKFFKKRGPKSFEWYGEYSSFCGILAKYVKTADKILVVGCGNSELSADLYDVGYRNLINIDISATVIRQMTEKNVASRPDLSFQQMDISQMTFGDGEFSVCLDKGTLDAIFSDDSPEVHVQVDKMLAEVGRVLRVGGRYICISLAQPFIARRIVERFASEGWMTRVCRVPSSEESEEEKQFYLPVFIFVFTKFRKMPNSTAILETAYFEDRVERVDSVEKILSSLSELQQYALVRQQLHKGDRLDEQISLDLYSSASNSPRYTIYVVDGTRSKSKKFAIFIVPQGREMEWMFSTNEGRMELHKSCGYERLLVVLLHRDHEYGTLEDVKAELSGKVLELAPPNIPKQSPFLTFGDAINLRTVRYKGNSSFSGDFVIEDVDVNGQEYRRLIFLNRANVIQSEARLVKAEQKKGKGKSVSSTLKVDHETLASLYYSAIVAGLAFVENLTTCLDTGLSVLLIGLGGGDLAMYLRNKVPKITMNVVELDPAIVAVATDWFGFVTDDRMVVHVADGLEFVRCSSVSGQKNDVVILDVDNKDVSVGMSCPPSEFIQVEYLQSVRSILNPSGLLVLNFACRSKEMRDVVITNLKSCFAQVFSKKLKEDVNEVLYCLPTSHVETTNDGRPAQTLMNSFRTLQNSLKSKTQRGQQKSASFTFEFDGICLL